MSVFILYHVMAFINLIKTMLLYLNKEIEASKASTNIRIIQVLTSDNTA